MYNLIMIKVKPKKSWVGLPSFIKFVSFNFLIILSMGAKNSNFFDCLNWIPFLISNLV